MNILVTGGAGYLGSVLVPELLGKGFHVTVLDNLMYGQNSLLSVADHPKFRFVRGDCRDKQTLAPLLVKADAVVPLAAIVGAPACDRDSAMGESVNLDAIRMLNNMRSKNQVVLFPTTNSGYGSKSGEVHCTEGTPLEPISLYGRTKVQAENDLLDKGGAVTLRLATVFGVSPRMRIDLLVNHFVYEAYKRGYLVVYQKDFKRNYIHIRDVSDCFLFCLDQFDRVNNQAYNVGLDSANYSKEELANHVKAEIPNFFVVFSEIDADPDKRNYIVSNEKIRSKGFSARRDVVQGIRELIKAYQMLPSHGLYANA